MLYLKTAKLICDLAPDTKPHELKALKFGFEALYEGSSTVVLASQFVPDQEALLVFRVQSYAIDVSNTETGYQIPRAVPRGVAYWLHGSAITDTTGFYQASSLNAPSHLPLDCDEMLLFPPQVYANLIWTPNTTPPATGTWYINTTVFGFLIPPQTYEALGGLTDWLNVQQ